MGEIKKIEIIATTVEDALQIEAGGADRIELVSALSEGGLTPSAAMIEAVVKQVSLPVNVMIRPHARSFHYTDNEIAVMQRDIEHAKEWGANGVVFGVLDATETHIDEVGLTRLLTVCDGLDVTFHRAIDEMNPVEGIITLQKYPQITNILTSGGKGKLEGNIAVLCNMMKQSSHIHLLVGGGLTKQNIHCIMEKVQASQYHIGTAVRENSAIDGAIDLSRLTEVVNIVKSYNAV